MSGMKTNIAIAAASIVAFVVGATVVSAHAQSGSVRLASQVSDFGLGNDSPLPFGHRLKSAGAIEVPTPGPFAQSGESASRMVQDERYLYVDEFSRIVKIDKATMKIVGTTDLGEGFPSVGRLSKVEPYRTPLGRPIDPNGGISPQGRIDPHKNSGGGNRPRPNSTK